MKTSNDCIASSHAACIRFALSGFAAVCAQTIVQPIELAKVRLQIGKYRDTSMNVVLKKIVKHEGFFSLWKGLIPSLMRELSYSSMRFGMYVPLKDMISSKCEVDNIAIKIIAGGMAGGIGAAISNPFDLLKCQSQASYKPIRQKNLLKAALKNEGLKGLWKGCFTTINRAIILGSVKLASYDEIKYALVKCGIKETSMMCVLISALFTGLIVACVIAPIDFARTRYMSSCLFDNKYTSGFAVILRENPLKWYKGFLPLWLRLGPYSVIHFVIWEKMCNLLNIKAV